MLPVSDATEVAPMTDGIILVYKVGQIGRGVLKRAKSALDNVNAKVLGTILNNVKPEVGPDYFRYQTHYYYGTQEKKKPKKIKVLPKIKDVFGKVKNFLPAGNLLKFLAAVLAVSLLIIGLFWQNIMSLFKALM